MQESLFPPMAFHQRLPMIALLLFGIQLSVSKSAPSVEREDEDVSHHTLPSVHNRRELTSSMEELRSLYLDEKIKMEKRKNEGDSIYPAPYVRLDEFERNITAMELNLKARYLLFYKVMESFNHSMNNVESSGEAFSTLVNALHELPDMSREILFDYLNFIEFGNVNTYGTTTFIDGDGTRNETDLLEMEKRSLKIVEASLVVANNVFPGKVQETREPLTLAIQIIRMILRGTVQLSFSDLEPFFVAMSRTGQYMDEKYPSYSNDNIEFPLSALYDAIKELCNLAAKLDIRGQLLKYYFERRLGVAWKNLDIRSTFSRIGDVADAAKSL